MFSINKTDQKLPVSCSSVQIFLWAIQSERNPKRLMSLRRDAKLYSNVPIALSTPDAPLTRCAFKNTF